MNSQLTRERDRERERETDRQRERWRERDRERQGDRERQTDRHTEKNKERHRDRERFDSETEKSKLVWSIDILKQNQLSWLQGNNQVSWGQRVQGSMVARGSDRRSLVMLQTPGLA